MKRIIVVLLSILVLGYLGLNLFKQKAKLLKDKHCLITQVSSRILDLNTLEIKVYDGLNKNDFQLINLNSGDVIYKNGQYLKGIKNEHGYCLFDLYYKGKKLFKFGHYKFNNWQTNNYVLHLSLNKDLVKPRLEFLGKDKSLEKLFYSPYFETEESADFDFERMKNEIVVKLSEKIEFNWNNKTSRIKDDSLLKLIKDIWQGEKFDILNQINNNELTQGYICPSNKKLSKGGFAFLLLDELEEIPYFDLFQIQFDSYELDCKYPNGLLDFVERKPKIATSQLEKYLKADN